MVADVFRSTRLWRVLAVTWLVYAAYSMGRRPLSVARSVIAKDTGMSVADTGAVDTSFLVMYTVGQLAFGAIQRASGLAARDLLCIGLTASGGTLFLLASCSSVGPMCVVWGLNGLLQAVGWASCMVVITPWLGSSERGVVMGVWGTTMAVGGVLGNTLMPSATAAWQSWRGGASVIGAAMIAVGVLARMALGQHPNAHGHVSPVQAEKGWAGTLDEIRRGASRTSRTVEGELLVVDADADGPPAAIVATDAAASSRPATPNAKPLSAGQLLAVPGVLGICGSYFCAKLVRYVLMFWLPFYFTTELKHGPAVAGMLASALDVGGLVGSIASGYLSDRYEGGRRRSAFTAWLCVGMAASLCGYSVLGSYNAFTTYAVGVAFCAGMFTYGIDSIMTGSLVQDFAERQRLTASLGGISGLVGGLGTLGSVLQGPFTVVLSGASWPTLFAVLQGLTLLSAVCLYRPLLLERL